MPVCHAALMCHAPIVIPAIGGQRAEQCAGTTRAMAEIADAIAGSNPDVLVIISPHAPREPRSWGVGAGPALAGDFSRFGRPDVTLSLPGAPAASTELERVARRSGLNTWSPPQEALEALDHGAAVPLYFLCDAGFRGPTLLICLPYPGTDTEERFGAAIAEASGAQRWAVLASGDMSHRLQEDAPAGFHPRAGQFDAAYVAALRGGDLRGACSPSPDLQQLAAEDVIDSTRVAAAASGYASGGLSVLHYEAPFGVGYCEAVLHDEADGGRRALLSIARGAIDALTRSAAFAPPAVPPPLQRSRGVFITLREASGALRGCIGHMQAQHATLAQEVTDCAQAAARSDPRFAPVTADELAGLTIEISLLTTPEPVTDLTTLDAKRYGVLVSHGACRGVLLPNIDGIDTVEQQLRIAGDKGGLPTRTEAWKVERFEIEKFSEAEPADATKLDS